VSLIFRRRPRGECGRQLPDLDLIWPEAPPVAEALRSAAAAGPALASRTAWRRRCSGSAGRGTRRELHKLAARACEGKGVQQCTVLFALRPYSTVPAYEGVVKAQARGGVPRSPQLSGRVPHFFIVAVQCSHVQSCAAYLRVGPHGGDVLLRPLPRPCAWRVHVRGSTRCAAWARRRGWHSAPHQQRQPQGVPPGRGHRHATAQQTHPCVGMSARRIRNEHTYLGTTNHVNPGTWYCTVQYTTVLH